MTAPRPTTCSACAFVATQLGANTPCPSHAGAWPISAPLTDHVAATATRLPNPTVDQPWPFTVHEYARLLLLRSRA